MKQHDDAAQLNDAEAHVDPKSLVVGRTYYAVQFVGRDDDLSSLVPMMRPLIYLGQSLFEGDPSQLHGFEDAGSHFERQSMTPMPEPEDEEFCETPNYIYDLEAAIRVLWKHHLVQQRHSRR
ncbi:MAG: hypothetical protein JST92_05440 [Deltaproteobacteria bacterium]|nr:hypothetical protein [Deltaproteobacteria bacterium]